MLSINGEQVISDQSITTGSDPEVSENLSKKRKALRLPKAVDGEFFKFNRWTKEFNFISTCVLCDKDVAAAVTGTSNCIRHIRIFHPNKLSAYNAHISNKRIANSDGEGKTQPKISDLVVTPTRILELTMNYILKSYSPINIVRCDAFKNLIHGVCGKPIQLPSTEKIVKKLSTDYTNSRANLQNLLNKQVHVCTTADVWTKRAKSYLGVTCHFIDESFIRHSYLLAFRRIEGSQTHANIGRVLSDIHNEFDLSQPKVTHCVTDGGSNFKAAFQKFGTAFGSNTDEEIEHTTVPHEFASDSENNDSEGEEEVDFSHLQDIQPTVLDFYDIIETDLLHNDIVLPSQMRCFAHLLNLIGKNDFTKWLKQIDITSFNLLSNIFKKLKLLWNAYSRRSSARSIIEKELGSGLITPGETRWNSEFDSVSKVLAHKDKV